MKIWWEYPHNYIQFISLEVEILRLGMEQSRVNVRGSTKVRGPNQMLHPSNTNMVKSVMCCFVVDLSVWAHETRTGCRNSSEDTSINLNFFFFLFCHKGHSMVVGDSECMQTQATDRIKLSWRPIMKWPLCPITLGEMTFFPCDLGNSVNFTMSFQFKLQ